MASTLKLENVAPPISGSVVSMPSMANTVVMPRCPLTVNCWVKLAAPLVSVCVPAASRSSWLKSRLLRGSAATWRLESSSPPVDSEAVPGAGLAAVTGAGRFSFTGGCDSDCAKAADTPSSANAADAAAILSLGFGTNASAYQPAGGLAMSRWQWGARHKSEVICPNARQSQESWRTPYCQTEPRP